MGGILTDANGRTTLDGLWACGETSSTGAHGANRLASNSLLEAVVYAARIADDIAGRALPSPARLPEALVTPHNAAMDAPAEKRLRAMMSANVGVVRDGDGLAEAVQHFAALERHTASAALRNMATSALLVAASAFTRRESRGGHFRSDHPTENTALAQRTMTTLAAARDVAEQLSDRPGTRTAQAMIA
jgi:L-aspartate oxidase